MNVVGCGSLGRTMAFLWLQHGLVQMGDVLNRGLESAKDAVGFIGGGTPKSSFSELLPADLVMVSASDAAIESCANELAQSGVIGRGTLVFHCSGFLPSSVLDPVRAAGAMVASLHPVKSFADPRDAVLSFNGTYCGVEGDAEACEILCALVEPLGGIPFSVDASQKTIYHAAGVFTCNYMTALIEVGVRCYIRAGITRETAMALMEPIAKETVRANFSLGPALALTGPIARGDFTVVKKQLDALHAWNPAFEVLYRSLGEFAADLSAEQGTATTEELAEVRALLRG